jgi:hypothetical protein
MAGYYWRGHQQLVTAITLVRDHRHLGRYFGFKTERIAATSRGNWQVKGHSSLRENRYGLATQPAQDRFHRSSDAASRATRKLRLKFSGP